MEFLRLADRTLEIKEKGGMKEECSMDQAQDTSAGSERKAEAPNGGNATGRGLGSEKEEGKNGRERKTGSRRCMGMVPKTQIAGLSRAKLWAGGSHKVKKSTRSAPWSRGREKERVGKGREKLCGGGFVAGCRGCWLFVGGIFDQLFFPSPHLKPSPPLFFKGSTRLSCA